MNFDPDRRKALSLAGGAALAAAMPGMAAAQSLPTGTIRMLVGYPAGGGTDVMARIMAEKLKERIGANVIVENRAGASGTLAVEALKNAPTDGSVIMYAPSAATVAQTVTKKSLPYDLVKDIATIGLTGTVSTVFVVSPTIGVKNLPEYIEWLKKNPKKASFGSTAMGSSTGAQFVTSTGVFLAPTNSLVQIGVYNPSSNVFTQFATGDLTPITIGVIPPLLGRWSGSFSDLSIVANSFNGQPIWVRIAVDLGAGTTGLAYFGSTSVFPTNGFGVGDNLNVFASGLTSIDADASTPGSAAFVAPGGGFANGRITIGVVPEPAAGLLFVLGAIGLLRRRR